MIEKTRALQTLADYFTDEMLSDPHVRIVGRKEDVLRVKDKVMAVLDAKVSEISDPTQSLIPSLEIQPRSNNEDISN